MKMEADLCRKWVMTSALNCVMGQRKHIKQLPFLIKLFLSTTQLLFLLMGLFGWRNLKETKPLSFVSCVPLSSVNIKFYLHSTGSIK